MNSNRRFGAFSSSENPEELAGRVKAVILAAGTLIIWGASTLFKIHLTSDDIISLATSVSATVAAIWAAYSSVKAVAIWAIDKWHTKGNAIMAPEVPQL